MRMNYVVLGVIFTIFGLATLMSAGGLIDIEIRDDDFNEDDELGVSASFGLAAVLGWAVFLTGGVILVIGLVSGPPYETFDTD